MSCLGAVQDDPSKVSTAEAESRAAQNEADAHDTEPRPSGLTRRGWDHVLPLNVSTLPCSPYSRVSTAAQKELEGHDTDIILTESLRFESILSGVDHVDPSNLTAFRRPTAIQKEADGHDTEARPPTLGSMRLGDVHEVPLNVTTFPSRSTAAQNDAEGHDTEFSAELWSTTLGADHEMPLNVIAFPLLSTAAQNDAEGQDTEVRYGRDP